MRVWFNFPRISFHTNIWYSYYRADFSGWDGLSRFLKILKVFLSNIKNICWFDRKQINAVSEMSNNVNKSAGNTMAAFPPIRILQQYTSEHITPDMWGRTHVALITPPTPLTPPVVIVNTGLASHGLAATREIYKARIFYNGRLIFNLYRSRGL